MRASRVVQFCLLAGRAPVVSYIAARYDRVVLVPKTDPIGDTVAEGVRTHGVAGRIGPQTLPSSPPDNLADPVEAQPFRGALLCAAAMQAG